MKLFALVLALAPFLSISSAPTAQEVDPVTMAYRAAHEAGDETALAALWKDNPGRILVTIDADLEGSLATWEAAPDAPDEDAIAALQARALFGARIASDVTGRPIFDEYASSFVGWDNGQKKSFRQGQRAHGRARKALQEGDARAALAAARECRGLALALGDWWGTAMGYAAEGEAQAHLGEVEEGLVASSQARLIYHQLGLGSSEYRVLIAMIAQLEQIDRPLRLAACLRSAIALGRGLGDQERVAAFEEQLAELDAQGD